MKKPNTLVLSYVIFLAITVVIHLVGGWEGVDGVALAASISSCFFAFSDLANWHVTIKTSGADAMEEYIGLFGDYFNKVKISLLSVKQETMDTMAFLRTYGDQDQDFSAPVVDACSDNLQLYEKWEAKISDALENMDSLKKAVEKDRKQAKWIGAVESALAICGFVAFFIMTSFDVTRGLLMPYASIFTIAAFMVIVLIYFLKEAAQSKLTQKMAGQKERIVRDRDDIAQIEGHLQNHKLLDSAKEKMEKLRENGDLRPNIPIVPETEQQQNVPSAEDEEPEAEDLSHETELIVLPAELEENEAADLVE